MTSIKSCLELLESWEIPRPFEAEPGAWVSEVLAGSPWSLTEDWQTEASSRCSAKGQAVPFLFLKHLEGTFREPSGDLDRGDGTNPALFFHSLRATSGLEGRLSLQMFFLRIFQTFKNKETFFFFFFF